MRSEALHGALTNLAECRPSLVIGGHAALTAA